ncbi:hypothetical protein EB796_020085 [Bugula neritina]|uniref:Uncharacterized protein n=1 Tax=Bugula neritina TaxID=10212 RepID=A0A7J7J776_BUGNE|nr:hypothetical protein EB796_020085 [Bugula neritina]
MTGGNADARHQLRIKLTCSVNFHPYPAFKLSWKTPLKLDCHAFAVISLQKDFETASWNLIHFLLLVY